MKIENNAAAAVAVKAQNIRKAESEKPSEAEKVKSGKRDEFVPAEKDEPIGLYKPEYDENGDKKIDFDKPRNEPGKKSESEECTCDTGKVDREIKKLREKAEKLEEKLRFSYDDKEKERIEKQLTAVQSELAQKDNDAYRKSNADYS